MRPRMDTAACGLAVWALACMLALACGLLILGNDGPWYVALPVVYLVFSTVIVAFGHIDLGDELGQLGG